MNKQTGMKQIIGSVFQFFGAIAAFLFSMVAANLILPMPAEIVAAAPPDGFLPTPLAFLFNGAVNALILVWAGRRSSFRGLRMGG